MPTLPTGEGRTCILHIGMHKTGTSSIQQTIADNAGQLLERFSIASYGRHINNSWLAPAFIDDLSQVWVKTAVGFDRPEEVRQRAADAVEELRQTLEALRPEQLVLSGEDFSKLPHAAVVKLKEFLAPYFDRVIVAVYVREPFSYAASAVAQIVKYGGGTFENLITNTLVHQETYSTDPSRRSVLPAYRYRIEKYIQTFGRDNVEIVPFERNALRNGDAVDDFFQRFLAIDIADLKERPPRQNETPSAGAIYALEYLNRTQPAYHAGKQNPDRAMNLPGKLLDLPRSAGFTIPGFDYHKFAEIVRPDVEWLREITGGAADFALEPPPAQPPTTDDLLAIAIALNKQSLERDRLAIRTVFFRELWRIGNGQTDDTRELARVLSSCNELEFLRTAAHILRLSKLPETAKLADERAAFLRPRQG